MPLSSMTSCTALFALAAWVLPAFALHQNNEVELTASLVEPFTVDDNVLVVTNHVVLVEDKTRFRDLNKNELPRYIMQTEGDPDKDRSVSPGFYLKKGQWLKIKATYDGQGQLVAKKVTQINSDRYAFKKHPPRRHDKEVNDFNRLHPFEALTDDDGSSAPGLRFRLGQHFLFGGVLELNNRWEDERDLDRSDRKDKENHDMSLKLSGIWRINRNDFLLIEPNFRSKREFAQDADTEAESFSRLSRGYIYKEINSFMAVHAGRMNFDDEREWLYDDILDSARVYFYTGPWLFDVSFSGGRELLDVKNNTQNITNMMGDLRYYFGKRHFTSLWTIHREHEEAEGFSPDLTGFRYYLRQSKGINFWLETATAGGTYLGKPIDGYAYDVGINYKTRTYPRHYYFIGYAFASGSDTESQDNAFRQSRLQGNSAKFGGVSSYKYYGEVIRPELSNRIITTIGAGSRPQKNLSIDVVYHRYRQTELTTDLGDTKIKADPNGKSRDIGEAVEIIFAYRTKPFKLELITGTFFPGDAFHDNESFDEKDAAHRTEIAIDLKF